MKSAFRTMLQAVKDDIASRFSHLKGQGVLKVGIANTPMAAEALEAFRLEMQQNFPDMVVIYSPLTMSIGTHSGPGGLGIGVLKSHR